MATDKSGRLTFPVWVGSLDENVSEKQLQKKFSKFGSVSSVKIQRDGATGRSKGFGWVNFNAREPAEQSAAKMAGAVLHGSAIKTRGPTELEKRGLFSPPKTDFRPLTDCCFFVQGKLCKKGVTCEYRHSEKALQTEQVCFSWRDKRCTNRSCPLRHPGRDFSRKSNSSSAGSPPPEVAAAAAAGGGGGGVGVLVCGGKCGDLSCSLSFSSPVTLSHHIQLSQLLCTGCNTVCSSQAELREHRKTCPRTHRDSASTHSVAVSDVEVLSDTSESLTSDEEEEDVIQEELLPAPNRRGTNHPSPIRAAVGGSKKGGEGEKGGRGKRRQRQKKKVGVPSVKSATNVKQTAAQKKTRMRKASSEAVRLGASNLSPPSDDPSPVLGVGGGEILNHQDVYFGIGSDSSESSDDEDDLEYTPAEMAQLLSLNELDMQPCSGSDSEENVEEEEEEEGKGEGGGAKEGGELREKKRRRHQSQNKEVASNSASGTDLDSQALPGRRVPRPQQRAVAHTRQPEPVGLFWDIENCSVPGSKSAFAVAAKMRRVFFECKREAEFMVVCDITKERKEVIDSLNKAQVTLVHVNAVAKNAADDKLRQSLRRFAHTYPAPSTVVLVSSDVNFSSELNDLRHVHNMTIVLVHSRFTSDALKVFAQQLVSYEQFLEDVEGPRVAQQPSLPNILLVTNLPKHYPPKKISSRLGQLSDNCGGHVLGVDPASGTARILFRTHEWATKAEKRMRGEDVFGCKINLCPDYSQQRPPHPPPPPHNPHPPPPPRNPHPLPPPHNPHPLLPRNPHPPVPPPLFRNPPPVGPHGFHHLSGPSLGNSFPPANRPPFPFSPSPPLPRASPPPRPLFAPNHPPNVPLLQSPRSPPPFSGPPPPSVPLPPNIQSPPRPPVQPASYSKMAAVPPPRPEGKILLINIPVSDEANLFEEVERQVLMITLEANIKMERERSLVMLHSFSELQMLLRLDFLGTAVVRKEELIRAMWDRGDLKPNVAEKFVEQCVKSLGDVCRRQGLSWQVTSCGWSGDEEEERRIKSQVIGLLRRYSNFWVKWTRFKKKYNENFHSGLSEMAVHTCCKGAVMILGKPDNSQSQVIIRYEMSPLVRISGQKKLWMEVQNKVVDMLSTRPEGRINLLNVVREYMKEVGPLPIGGSGKSLQDVLSSCPRLQFVGSKPSAIYLTLVPPTARPPPPPPSPLPPPERPAPPQRTAKGGDLDKLSTEFRHLLKMQTPHCEMPLSRLQQEYQTFYHHSFRVADYLPSANGESGKMRSLMEACTGIELKEVKLPNGRTETVVCLESEAAAAAVKPMIRPSPSDTVADCELRVRDLLCSLPDYQITLDRFMGEYEKKYGHKMSYYGHAKLTGLLETFTSTLCLSDEKGPTRPVQLQPLLVLAHELSLLLSAQGGKLPISQIVPEYREMFGRNLVVSQFGFPKLIKALEALPDAITLKGIGASRIAALKKPVTFLDSAAAKQFVEELTVLLLSTHNKKKSVAELTSNYNEVFRGPATASKLPPITIAEMADTLSRMPAFSVTGAGPVQYVSFVQQLDKEKKKKEKTTNPPQKAELEPLEPAASGKHSSPEQTGTTGSVAEETVGRAETAPLPLIPPPATIQPATLQKRRDGGSEGGAYGSGAAAGTDLVTATGEVGRGGKDGEESGRGSLMRFSDRESQRLTSETQRLLQSHPEHAMTIGELIQSFVEVEDPARPQPEELSLCLHKHNVRKGGSKSPKLFQLSNIPGSVGDSLVQLNRPDCISKLGLDLLHLFVVQPTPQLDLSLAQVNSLYLQTYGRRLIPAVYGMKTLEGLIEKEKQLNILLKLDETKQLCSLADSGCQKVMASLLVELLYLRGREDGESLAELPRLFHLHFGFSLPLSLLSVESVSGLLELRELQTHIKVTERRAMLKDVTRFAEQLRFILTQNGGRLSLHDLPELYQSAFGPPPDTEGKDWLSRKLIQYAPNVVNLTGNQWVIWAPAGRPYPARRHSKLVVPSSPHDLVFGRDAGAKDLVEMEEGMGGREKADPVGSLSTCPTHTATHTNTRSSLPGEMRDKPHSTQPSEPTSLYPTLPPLFTDLLDFTTEDSPGSSAVSSSTPGPPPKREERMIVFDESPYGFLERDPDLLARLTVREEDEETAVSTEDALQRLIDAGSLLDKPLVPNLPPPLLPDPISPQPPTGGEEKSPTKDPPPRGTLPATDGTTDYLKAGLKPDEVLQELYRVKDRGGGVINPASMEPFLSYFGELSSRELERLEAQEAKLAKPPSPAPTKGMLRKKRMMAIRFPGQDPDPSEMDPDLRRTLDSLQLPEVPSDSSGDEGDPTVPVRPLSHAELVEELMSRGPLLPQRGGEEGGEGDSSVSGGVSCSGPQSKPPPPYY